MNDLDPHVREVTALFSSVIPGAVVMDGELFDSPEDTIARIRREDRKYDFAITVINWENCPPGFVPPA